jgi:serine/threonine-protein kinase
MFLDEAKIASRIRHPNVVALDDVGEADGVPFMVLEWLEGDPLSRISDQASKREVWIPLPILLRICADACVGLHAAHELRDATGQLMNVVHRDVSHQNILVTTDGVTKVIDFGVAKAADRLAENTKTGHVKGKLEYSAPEYLRDQKTDRRADVWAIGVVLYREMTGRFPFEADTDFELLQAITSGTPPPPLPAEIPQPVAEAVMRALQADPADRFSTCADMARALDVALPDKASTADVAAFAHELLAARIEVRRRHLADALARFGPAARDDEKAPVSGPLAALPPEALPLHPERADDLVVPTDTNTSTTALEGPIAPRIGGRHLVSLFAATAITLAVWGSIAFVLMTSPRLHPAPAAGAR